jgi:hypothetical protein
LPKAHVHTGLLNPSVNLTDGQKVQVRPTDLSFPKIRSGEIRTVRENQTIIQCDVCDHLPAWNIRQVNMTISLAFSRTGSRQCRRRGSAAAGNRPIPECAGGDRTGWLGM